MLERTRATPKALEWRLATIALVSLLLAAGYVISYRNGPYSIVVTILTLQLGPLGVLVFPAIYLLWETCEWRLQRVSKCAWIVLCVLLVYDTAFWLYSYREWTLTDQDANLLLAITIDAVHFLLCGVIAALQHVLSKPSWFWGTAFNAVILLWIVTWALPTFPDF